MTSQPGPSLIGRAMAAVITLLVVAAAGRLIWELLAPMLGVLFAAGLMLGVSGIAVRRFRGW